MVNPQQEFAIKGSPKAFTSSGPTSYQKGSMWFTADCLICAGTHLMSRDFLPHFFPQKLKKFGSLS